MARRYSILVLVILAVAVPAFANHSWGGYHWARTSNPFTLKVGDNVTSQWDPILVTTISDWSKSVCYLRDVFAMTAVGANVRCHSIPRLLLHFAVMRWRVAVWLARP